MPDFGGILLFNSPIGKRMRMRVETSSVLVCALSFTHAFALTQGVPLFGINTYQPDGTLAVHPADCGNGRSSLIRFEDPHGAVNDAESMADLLTSPKFSFPPSHVVLLTNPAAPRPRPEVQLLPASEASHEGILEAMQRYLVDQPNPGDAEIADRLPSLRLEGVYLVHRDADPKMPLQGRAEITLSGITYATMCLSVRPLEGRRVGKSASA